MKTIVTLGIALSLLVGFAHAEEATSESLEQWEENIKSAPKICLLSASRLKPIKRNTAIFQHGFQISIRNTYQMRMCSSVLRIK